ncbi:IS630 family transposase [Candidatus Parcubacteria bacterium]|nr:MAG: IS630 family transposase [Candidatus Parcubacteria bacterium]
MARPSQRAKLQMTNEELQELRRISRSRTERHTRVERARMLLAYHAGQSVTEIARQFQTNRPRVERTIDRALSIGVLASLDDLPRPGKPAKISSKARAWILSLACQKPKDFGYAAELWTTRLLAQHIRNRCHDEGYPELAKLSRGTVSKILRKAEIRPHKIRYYVERRDPDFDNKMVQVLHVYQEVALLQAEQNQQQSPPVALLSYDEKPGIQAIQNVSPDRLPSPEKQSTLKRDYEYKRLGTVSLLASIDLISGEIHAQVADRHRSKEFIEHLKYLDEIYSESVKIKIILDNHSAHTSKETQQYLKTVPNRFEFIFTPTHGSWLNLIETFFSKLSRCFLKGMRVDSINELKTRMLAYIDECNEMPTIFKWTYILDEIKTVH